jgi:signal transduction histidine kinase
MPVAPGTGIATWSAAAHRAINIGTRGERFPADAEQRMAGFTELVGTAIANADSRAQLTASRARIVAAADDARRRIERDLHDGTQQRLVALSLELRLAQSTVPAELPKLQRQIGRVADELNGAIEELRELARGIHPAILSEGGLGPPCAPLPAVPRSRWSWSFGRKPGLGSGSCTCRFATTTASAAPIPPAVRV